TPGGWDVFELLGVDEQSKVLYFTGAMDGPLGRPLLRIGLDGKGLTRISTEPGTHAVEFDPTFARYVDTYSRAGVPPVQTLRRANGTLVRTIADDAKLAAQVTALGVHRPEFITIRTADGDELRPMHAQRRHLGRQLRIVRDGAHESPVGTPQRLDRRDTGPRIGVDVAGERGIELHGVRPRLGRNPRQSFAVESDAEQRPGERTVDGAGEIQHLGLL